MANEATVTAGLLIAGGAANNNANLSYQSTPIQFSATVTGNNGPSPGAVTITTAGVDVDLSELTNPSLVRFRNLSNDRTVDIGIWDGTEFYPIFELLPGEFYVMRFSRNLGKSLDTNPGTGTVDTGTYTVRMKAYGGSANVAVEAFDL